MCSIDKQLITQVTAERSKLVK